MDFETIDLEKEFNNMMDILDNSDDTEEKK